MARTLKSIMATVSKVNENGMQTVEQPGVWINVSRYAEPRPTIPPVGSEVELSLDASGYIHEIRLIETPVLQSQPVTAANWSQPVTNSSTTPRETPRAPQSAPSRETAITRLACLKAASAFLASRPDAKTADVLKVAEAWEAWVAR